MQSSFVKNFFEKKYETSDLAEMSRMRADGWLLLNIQECHDGGNQSFRYTLGLLKAPFREEVTKHSCCEDCEVYSRIVSDLMLDVASLRMYFDAVARLVSFVAERILGERPCVLLEASDGNRVWTKFSSKGVVLKGDPEAPVPFRDSEGRRELSGLSKWGS
jgi:hypothetical protein